MRLIISPANAFLYSVDAPNPDYLKGMEVQSWPGIKYQYLSYEKGDIITYVSIPVAPMVSGITTITIRCLHKEPGIIIVNYAMAPVVPFHKFNDWINIGVMQGFDGTMYQYQIKWDDVPETVCSMCHCFMDPTFGSKSIYEGYCLECINSLNVDE
ncbi:hypothetical protein KDA11_02005 [Candidatus Saccharibacteria bacterium]|nr:hypothetical protein [Candidatus Saccharibacteria bacterium]